jgi:hypothetical protein
MNDERKSSAVLVACVLAVSLSSSASLSAEVHVPVIKINGLTGEISNPLTVVRPKTSVIVEVCPADLINYTYKIEKNELPLREAFEIVGVEPPAQGTSGGPEAPLGRDTILPIDATIRRLAVGSIERELLEKYRHCGKI